MAGSTLQYEANFLPELCEGAGSTAFVGSDKDSKTTTPRVHIFSDLGEAHRKITARLASNPELTSPKLHAGKVIPLQLVSHKATPITQDPSPQVGFPAARVEKTGHSAFKQPCYNQFRSLTALPAGSILPSSLGQAPRASCDQSSREQTVISDFHDQVAEPIREVEKIGSEHSSAALSRTSALVARTVEPSRRKMSDGKEDTEEDRRRTEDGIELPREEADFEYTSCPRVEYKAISISQAQVLPNDVTLEHRLQLRLQPSEPPKLGLPGLPSTYFDLEQKYHGRYVSSELCDSANQSNFSDSQLLYCGTDKDLRFKHSLRGVADLRDGNLIPQPLRIAEIKATTGRESSHDLATLSAFETATESDDEPFKYDQQNYKLFLQPSKEREVSQALRCISGVSMHSKGTLYQSHGVPPRNLVDSSQPPLPVELVANLRLIRDEVPTEGAFYNKLAIKSAWAIHSNPNEVKVPVGDRVQREVVVELSDIDVNNHSAVKGLIGAERGRITPRVQEVTTDGGEWVTVATSVDEFDMLKLPPIDGRQAGYKNYGAQETGSSVADMSDDGSMFHVQADAFSSTDRIIQHPPAAHTQCDYHLRTLKGTEKPIFIPGPRLYSVNGFPQNSNRVYADPSKSFGASLARKFSTGKTLSNPFSRSNSKVPSLVPSFLSYKRVTDSNKYELEDSLFEFNVSADRNPRLNTLAGNIHKPEPTHQLCPDSSRLEESEQAHGKFSKLPFPLLPLHEARRMQAERRISGFADETLSSRTRYQRAMSVMSSGAMSRSSMSDDAASCQYQSPVTPMQTQLSLASSRTDCNATSPPAVLFALTHSKFAPGFHPLSTTRDRLTRTASRPNQPLTSIDETAECATCHHPGEMHLYGALRDGQASAMPT